MKSRRPHLGFILALVLGLSLVMAPGLSRPSWAASEDVAMFYDELTQHGQWIEYENYGPVWQPSQVGEDWRPYTDGRWVPTNDGYVFESQEPWAWATYHYGNWMPTQGYGWVWVPGRTWYPSTVEWRTSPETAPVESSYIGWAPIPPPNYVPPPAYAPAQYYPGAPVTDALASPLWIFVRAASFLLGLGQPYAPAYSYYGCNCLAPPAYVPTFYPQTVIVSNYYTPAYYPRAFYGGRLGYAAYNWGPPVPYIARVTNINQVVINQTINYNKIHITKIHNVVPPHGVINKHGYIRHIIPPALAQGKPLPPPQRVQNIKMAQANLYKPNIIPKPAQAPQLQAQIPRVQPMAHQPGQGIPGAGLPGKSMMSLTPHMQQQIQKVPPHQQVMPAKPMRPSVAAPPQPGMVQPGGPAQPGPAQIAPPAPGAKPGQARPGQFQPGVRPGQARPGVAPSPGLPPSGPAAPPGAAKPVSPTRPGTAHPGGPPPAGQFQPGGKPSQIHPATPPQRGTPPPATMQPQRGTPPPAQRVAPPSTVQPQRVAPPPAQRVAPPATMQPQRVAPPPPQRVAPPATTVQPQRVAPPPAQRVAPAPQPAPKAQPQAQPKKAPEVH